MVLKLNGSPVLWGREEPPPAQHHHSQSLGGKEDSPARPLLSPADLSEESSIRLTRSWYVVLTGDRVFIHIEELDLGLILGGGLTQRSLHLFGRGTCAGTYGPRQSQDEQWSCSSRGPGPSFLHPGPTTSLPDPLELTSSRSAGLALLLLTSLLS